MAQSLQADGATEIVYIRYNLSLNQNEYRINNGIWAPLSLPVAVQNTNSDPKDNILEILFTTDITLINPTDYFICASEGIQFGSLSLKENGTRPKINIEDVNSYPGLIRNGSNLDPGNSYIYVCNLEVRSIGNTYLEDEAGWIGQTYFGNQAINNYIVNCFSDGDISENGGGIVGSYAGKGDGTNPESSNLRLGGCSSQGNIGTAGGGICGYSTGSDGGFVNCNYCWQEFGSIGTNAGGIFGQYAASGESSIGGSVHAVMCYSRGGIVGQNAGGIFGQLAGTSGYAYAEACYSQGTIGTDAGGIFGGGAASDGGTTDAINCYSSGMVTTSGNGIYSGGITIGRSATNCYVANDNWVDDIANNNLTYVPNPKVGDTWVSVVSNTPYELNSMGYTPYTIDNIGKVPEVPYVIILGVRYDETIEPGQTSIPAIRPGYSYDILQISEGDPTSYNTITMNDNTGVISTTSATAPGNYIITLRNTGSYNITYFYLTVASPIPSIANISSTIPPCCQPICPQFNQTTNNTQEQLAIKQTATAIASDVDSTYLAINQNKSVNFAQPAFKSYRDYMIYLQSKYR